MRVEKIYDAEIWTEGNSDILHLRKALEKLDLTLNISFHENQKTQGNKALFKKCEIFSEKYQSCPMIFIFDRDNKEILKKVTDKNGDYKIWGNNVFSFAIPIPSHRNGYENICIELYYTDDEIKTKDLNGRRLFFTYEFNESSGKLKQDPTIHIANKGKLKRFAEKSKTKVVDSEVYDLNDKNIALSKMGFAQYVFSDEELFHDFKFNEFKNIFAIIENIIKTTQNSIVLSAGKGQTNNGEIETIQLAQKKENENKLPFSEDVELREYERFVFEVRRTIKYLFRKICVGRDSFPPIEIDFDQSFDVKRFKIIISFPSSDRHYLLKPLIVLLYVNIKDLNKKIIKIDHAALFSLNSPQKIKPKTLENLFEDKFNEDRLETKFVSLLKLIFIQLKEIYEDGNLKDVLLKEKSDIWIIPNLLRE